MEQQSLTSPIDIIGRRRRRRRRGEGLENSCSSVIHPNIWLNKNIRTEQKKPLSNCVTLTSTASPPCTNHVIFPIYLYQCICQTTALLSTKQKTNNLLFHLTMILHRLPTPFHLSSSSPPPLLSPYPQLPPADAITSSPSTLNIPKLDLPANSSMSTFSVVKRDPSAVAAIFPLSSLGQTEPKTTALRATVLRQMNQLSTAESQITTTTRPVTVAAADRN